MFCFFSTGLFAQNNSKTTIIRGSVIDSSTNKPMDLVTVVLQDAKSHESISSDVTKNNGGFLLKTTSTGPFELILIFVGYKNKIVPVTGSGTEINLGMLMLSASSRQLGQVSVTAAKPLMKQEVDKITYDIQADPDSRQLSVLEMMRKVPLLTIDANDKIQLKGSSNYKILINGRESAMMANDPSDILKAMPATNIERIEVITTPPAKYDAEGVTGIINIVTRRNVDQGYNIGMFARMNSVYGPGYNLNGTMKEGKLGLSFFGGVGRSFNGTGGSQPTGSGSTETIFATQSSIIQKGAIRQDGYIHYAGADLSYEIDTLNLVTASFNLLGENLGLRGSQVSNVDSAGITEQGYGLASSGYTNTSGFDASVNYQLGFKRSKDQLLTFSYKYSYAPNSQFNNNIFSDRFNYPAEFFPDYQQYNSAANKDHTVQIDYAGPLTNAVGIETGAKMILRDNYSGFHVDDRDTATQQYGTNASLTNNFNYHQDIYSLYNSYQLKRDTWTGKAGLRLEHTAISADFISAGVTAAPSYTNLIPSVSIQRSFTSSSINLGFTQRIQRPGIAQLNPFVDRSNPAFVSTGNPGLRPELDNTFDLSYSNFKKGSVNIDLSYAFSNNSIQTVSSLAIQNVNNKLDTVTYTTFENLGANKTVGLNINTNLAIGKLFTLTMNGQLNHVWLSGILNGSMYHNDGFTGTGFGSARYKFGQSNFAFTFNLGYYSGNVNLQGHTSDVFFNQYLFTKDFFNRKLTIGLAINDPYSKFYVFRTTINSASFYQMTFQDSYRRSFALRFNYRFGKLKGDIKRNEHGIENDDTKSTDNGKHNGGP
ncbi:MAG TPA: outer membrane beta-barrel protein [Mucilaginibacter sp.]|nr:outer membrane beta-barrel protein [Mucilaginibacter sp.]